MTEQTVQGLIDQAIGALPEPEPGVDEQTVQRLIREAIAAIPEPDPGTALHQGVTLPGPARAMRIGWNQTQAIPAAVFIRANQHPIDGVAMGMTTPGGGGSAVPAGIGR